MKRKIVQHGNTSLTVSLPIKWAKKFNLKKGDEIDVDEKNNTIIVSTENSFKIDQKEIDTEKLDCQTLKWLLSALYKRGHDEIRVVFEKSEHMAIIQERVNQLLGYAIIEQTHNSCIIKNISEALEEQFDSTLKRAFLLTISMGESINDLMKKNNDLSNLKSLINIEETNNQLTGFCHRIINKKGYKDFNKTSFIYTIIWLLESIADEYRDICKYYIKEENKNTKISRESTKLFEQANSMVRMLYEAFYSFSNEKVVKIAEIRKEIREKSNKIISESKSNEAILVKYLDNLSQRVADSIGSLLGLNG